MPNGTLYTDLHSFSGPSERGSDQLDDINERTTWHWLDWLSQRGQIGLPSIWSDRVSLAMRERHEAMRLRIQSRARAEEQHIETPSRLTINEGWIGDHYSGDDHATDGLHRSEPTDQREIIWFRCGSGEGECQAATGGLVGALRTQYSMMLQKKIVLCCTTCQWELNERVPEVKVVYNSGEFSGQANDTSHLRMMLEERQLQTSHHHQPESEEPYKKPIVALHSVDDAEAELLSSADWFELRLSYQELMESLDFPKSPGSENG